MTTPSEPFVLDIWRLPAEEKDSLSYSLLHRQAVMADHLFKITSHTKAVEMIKEFDLKLTDLIVIFYKPTPVDKQSS